MRKKLQQFRRKIREDHLNTYKDNVRCNLMITIARDQKVDDLNRQLNACIEAKDTEDLFEKFMTADLSILKQLDLLTIFGSYRLLVENLQKYKTSQILREFVEIYTSHLFSEASLEATNCSMFQRLHRLADEMITQPDNSSNPMRKHHLQNYLATLCCFYSPRYHKLLKRTIAEKGEQLVCNYVIPWGNEAAHSIIYLRLLSNVMSNQILTGIWSRHPIDNGLIMRLSANLTAKDDRLVYWSLMTLNDSLQIWDSFSIDCLQQLIPRYLEIISIISPQIRSGKSSKSVEYKKQHLLESLISLEKMVRAIWEMKFMKFGLGRLMLMYDTFRLFSLVNQIEHFPDRCILYGLLDYTICVTLDLQHDDQALSLIASELQDTMMLGLGNKFSNHITLNSLHVIERLVRYESCAYSPVAVIKGFREAGIQTILQYLQFNKHQEVAAIALSLLDSEFSEQAIETVS